jgi:hypothetical protein
MSTILTHERIALTTGVLTASKGILFGGNALQSITIGRHTPKNVVQAIGYLGIVDYTSGTITSTAELDTILVEGCSKADAANKTNSIYKYAGLQATVGQESYVMTSFGNTWSAGSPTTANFGWMTSGLATYLDAQATPQPGIGEESAFAVVLGDDGSGIALVPTWNNATPTVTTNLPVLDVNGNLLNESDQGLPAGVQSISFTGSINRDQILDVRTTSPVQWVTTYPLDLRADVEIHVLPVASGVARIGDSGYNSATFKSLIGNLQSLSVQATALGKHVSGSAAAIANNNDVYVQAIGMTKTDETEGVSVGRYLTYNINFILADLLLPLPGISS